MIAEFRKRANLTFRTTGILVQNSSSRLDLGTKIAEFSRNDKVSRSDSILNTLDAIYVRRCRVLQQYRRQFFLIASIDIRRSRGNLHESAARFIGSGQPESPGRQTCRLKQALLIGLRRINVVRISNIDQGNLDSPVCAQAFKLGRSRKVTGGLVGAQIEEPGALLILAKLDFFGHHGIVTIGYPHIPREIPTRKAELFQSVFTVFYHGKAGGSAVL